MKIHKSTAKNNFSISVVVPVYNNAKILSTTVQRLASFCESQFADYEILFVDDASQDNSLEFLRKLVDSYSSFRVLSFPVNKGQQTAIFEGIIHAKGDIILNTDADLPFVESDILQMLQLTKNKYEVVFGRRRTVWKKNWWRRIGSFFGNAIFNLLFRYKIYDFGCSVAAVRREVVDRLRERKYPPKLIKLEVLRIAKSYIEFELQPNENSSKGKSSYTAVKLFKLLLQIFLCRVWRN
ncbi:MAG: Undecaprenyl-phosphate 4-deoxy-4-formamido-L-arabinose transferase [Turneriella sp.]|nr:Undecaprenyl-phosphate 4-deoxy-4-formamido-L-arabinose transferase [Turneriella sp.]